MEDGETYKTYKWKNLNIEYLGFKMQDKYCFGIVGEITGPIIYLSSLEATNLWNDANCMNIDDYEQSEW
jgi:hypothetical protein